MQRQRWGAQGGKKLWLARPFPETEGHSPLQQPLRPGTGSLGPGPFTQERGRTVSPLRG